ncbi:hypothetical protein [Flavobacterium sp.]|uniref:hypothetical protein n=1 Tax=Flavobacterium sp. TaxID=239 RepID=UPI0040338A88
MKPVSASWLPWLCYHHHSQNHLHTCTQPWQTPCDDDDDDDDDDDAHSNEAVRFENHACSAAVGKLPTHLFTRAVPYLEADSGVVGCSSGQWQRAVLPGL